MNRTRRTCPWTPQSIAAAAGIMAVLAGAATARPAANGGFESSTADGNTLPDPGWSAFDGAKIKVIAGAKKQPADTGGACARMHVDSDGSASGLALTQGVSGLTPGGSYTLTGAVRITKINGAGGPTEGFQVNLGSSKYGTNLGQFVLGVKHDWRPFSITFTAPAGGSAWIAALPSSIHSATAFFDSFTLEPTPTPGATAYRDAILAMNPVLYYRFNEISGSTIDDHAAAPHDATIVNTLVRALPGAMEDDACAYFDGSSSYLNANTDLNQWLGATASVAFWIRTTDNGKKSAQNAPALTGADSKKTINDCVWGWIDKKGRIGVTIGKAGVSGTKDITDNAWHHVVLTRHHATGAVQVYEDGVLTSSGTLITGIMTKPFSSIGRAEDHKGKHQYLEGMFDELVIFNRVITPAEVETLAAGAAGGDTGPRVTTWNEVSAE